MTPAGSQAAWSTWITPATREELLAQFADFGPGARAILEGVEAPNKWIIHGIYPPLETYMASIQDAKEADGSLEGKGGPNVVLIGDAAHAMLPFLASGAATGVEDAYVLGNLLAYHQTLRANLPVCRVSNLVRSGHLLFL